MKLTSTERMEMHEALKRLGANKGHLSNEQISLIVGLYTRFSEYARYVDEEFLPDLVVSLFRRIDAELRSDLKGYFRKTRWNFFSEPGPIIVPLSAAMEPFALSRFNTPTKEPIKAMNEMLIDLGYLERGETIDQPK